MELFAALSSLALSPAGTCVACVFAIALRAPPPCGDHGSGTASCGDRTTAYYLILKVWVCLLNLNKTAILSKPMAHPIPIVSDNHLRDDDSVLVGSELWYRWLEHPKTNSFRYESSIGSFTARKRPNGYWNAYQKFQGKFRQEYLGKTSELTQERLEAVVKRLALPESDYCKLKSLDPANLERSNLTKVIHLPASTQTEKRDEASWTIIALTQQLDQLRAQLAASEELAIKYFVQVQKICSQSQRRYEKARDDDKSIPKLKQQVSQLQARQIKAAALLSAALSLSNDNSDAIKEQIRHALQLLSVEDEQVKDQEDRIVKFDDQTLWLN